MLGNTKAIQKHYWDFLKDSRWNRDKIKMPKYAILEAVIQDDPDFDDLAVLNKQIEDGLVRVSKEIIASLNLIAQK